MKKASFSVERATQDTDLHTQRVNNFDYVILDNFRGNYFQKFYDYDEYLSKAKTKYKDTIKQNMQQSAISNLFQEAIISINDEHNEEDIIDLFFELKQKFGGHELINLAIHKDEGYFEKDGKRYYPNKNILKKEKEWFISSNDEDLKKEEDFTIKVNIDEFHKVLTPHAHAVFSMFDFNLGRNARMQKKDMVERLRFVAKILKMNYSIKKYQTLDANEEVTEYKEEEYKELDNQIYIKNTTLFDINNQVSAKELELEELNLKLATQHSILSDIINKIMQKESDFEDITSQILLKEDDIDNLSNIISIKNAKISSLDILIKQKELRLDEIDNQIYTKSHNIAI